MDVADGIWTAVESAILADWTPQRFKDEVSDAWEFALKEQANDAREVFKCPTTS